MKIDNIWSVFGNYWGPNPNSMRAAYNRGMDYVAYTAVGRAGNLTADRMQAADIDESGSIDSTDVYYLLYYIALNGVGVRSTWADVVK